MNFLRTDSQLDFLYNCITSCICGQVKVDRIRDNLDQYHRAAQDGAGGKYLTAQAFAAVF